MNEGFSNTSSDGPSTRQRALLQRRRFPFTLNGVTSGFAELHLWFRRFASVARFESWEKFNFSSVDGSASQSNHMPVQALANQTACLCVQGGRLMWLVVGRTPDTPTGKLQRTLPCGRRTFNFLTSPSSELHCFASLWSNWISLWWFYISWRCCDS